MEWDEKRPALSGAADWTYAMSPTTVLNVSVDANAFLLQNQRLGTRKYKPTDVGLPAYMDAEVRRQLRAAADHLARHDRLVRRHGSRARPSIAGAKGRQQAVKFNVSHIRNSHSLRAGVDFRQHYRTLIQNGGFTSGNFTFANNYRPQG